MTGRRLAGAALGLTVAATLAPGVASAETARVRVKDNFFSPKRIEITAGDRVKWVNRGDDTHSTTAKDGSWDKTMAPGERAGKKFRNPGTYRYFCTFHDGMRGKIVVT